MLTCSNYFCSHVVKQYLAAVCWNLGAMNFGIYFGWSAVANPRLQSPNSPELDAPMTDQEISYSTAFPFFVAVCFAVVWGYLANTCGRKITGYLTALCFIVCYGLILNTKSVHMLIIGRIIGGLTYIPVLFNGNMYIAEVAETQNFGRLSSTFLISQSFGTLMIFTMGGYVSFKFLNIYALVFGVLFLLALIGLPESPVFYLKNDRVEQAKASLQFFRPKNNADLLEMELKRLNDTFVLSKKIKLKYLFSRHTVVALCIAVYLQFALQFTGINYMSTYTVFVLEHSNTLIDPYICIKITGVVNTIAPCIYFYLTNKLGRKTIAIISYGLTSLVLGTLGWYFYQIEHSMVEKLSPLNYLPIVCMSLFFLFFSMGAGSINFTLYGEIFSSEVRNVVMPFIFVWSGLLSFLVVKLAPTLLLQTIHMSGVFWLFSTTSLVTVFFITFCIPETKDKPFLTVIDELTKKAWW